MKTFSLKRPLMQVLFFALSGILTSVQAQTQLSADEFEARLKATPGAQLMDVRTPAEYQDGHLAKSKNIDYKAADFEDKSRTLDKNKPVFVYCLSGGRSAAAAQKLAASGFKEVYDMKGGYLKWSSSGKEVEGGTATAASGMTLSDFTKLTSSSKVVLVDFYAKWCAPCVQMLPTITKLKSEYKGRVQIETVNYDPNKSLAKELGIYEIPAFLLYKDGKLITRKNGLLEEQDFRKLLDSNL
ncbi:thioredoxin domain-containing protein [Dyadobacter sandarakinus]|uniref:Thioredoxin fold domain-containing protein n=1 Tax=Dyadobacter sandarakinus TaxID=2747268 RepID=A0ABX7I2F8_9BACT|nr:thioredoxin domain-containing protein [Dyadobacter sandarakinus]QRR00068.1 thioredoxin fold domain-containing protein [Dyadobacter sandarakinus]